MTEQLSSTLEELATAQVTLVIPCLAEFVGVARLAILGVANRLSFNYDEVEDVRLAVGEACTNAIERAAEHRSFLTDRVEVPTDVPSLKIVSTIERSTLTIEVIDTIPIQEDTAAAVSSSADGIDYHKLGIVLMECLVDTVSFDAGSSGTTVKLVKTASQLG